MSAKKPEDHKTKSQPSAYDLIREEAGARDWGPLEPLRGQRIKLVGRYGETTVTVLDNMGDWDDDFAQYFGATQYAAALRCIVSNEDLAKMNQIKPSVASSTAAFLEAMAAGIEPGDVADLGEDSASQAS